MPASRFAVWGLLAVVCLVLAVQPAHVVATPPDTLGDLSHAQLRSSAKPDPQSVGRYIIQLAGEPLATFASQMPRSQGDQPTGQLDLASQSARIYQAHLTIRRQRVLRAIAQRIGVDPPVLYSYDVAFNGVAVELTAAQADQIAGLPGILSVYPEQMHELATDAGPTWIGADQIWDGSASGVYAATILGANESPPVSSSLSGRGTFTFDAASSTLAYTIIIGGPAATITSARIYRANNSVVAALVVSPTAGTYAGDVVLAPADAALLQDDQLYVNFYTAAHPDGEVRGTISGYKGEGVIVGMIDTGINTTHPSFAEVGGDGYRHLNPLGQGNYKGACDPTNLPAQVSGNPSGYNPAIICNNKLIGAWTFSMTASAYNQDTGQPSPNDEHNHGSHTASTAVGNVLEKVAFGGMTYPRISGVAPHANVIAYDACGYMSGNVYAADCPTTDLLAAVNQAVIDQVDVINYSISGGASPWDDPIEQAFLNARTAGIVVSASAGNSGPSPGTVSHISPWLLSVAATTHNRRLNGTTRDIRDSYGDMMAKFSSRGPAAGTTDHLLKPDLAAPGVDVFAAYANSDGITLDYGLMSGTSMAAPHISGSSALIAGLHPDWTPGQIQSALMTTSLAPIKNEDGSAPTTPFDSGSGRVRLERAARAGLVLDETLDHFIAANPGSGGDPRTLNLPNMTDPSCVFRCSWTRTLHNALDIPVAWTASTDTTALTVTPASFTIPASGDQVVTFTLNVGDKPFDTYVFDRATLTATDNLAPSASFMVAALPHASNLPNPLLIQADTGVVTYNFDLVTIPYASMSAQVYGLMKGTQYHFNLANDIEDVSTKLVVPENTARLVAEIQSSTSQDIDIFLVYDSNNNDTFEKWDPWACYSASEAVDEYCSVDNPPAGTYFVKVHNYLASTQSAIDPVTLWTAIVPNTPEGNFTVGMPPSSPGGPVSLTLNVNAPSSVYGDFWYGQIRLVDTATTTLIGVSDVDFHHSLSGPTSLAASGGAAQAAVINTPFTVPLSVVVTDSLGGRVPGVTVTFSGPASGARAVFPNGNTVVTDEDGIAQVIVQANDTPGIYAVTADALGLNGPLIATFSLENLWNPYTVYLAIVSD